MSPEPLEQIIIRLEDDLRDAVDRCAVPADVGMLDVGRRLEEMWEPYRRWPASNPERQKVEAFVRGAVAVYQLLLQQLARKQSERNAAAMKAAVDELRRLRL